LFNLNVEVAAAAKRHIEKRFGDGQVWSLNPGAPEANIPNGSGADCMPMLTQVLQGWEGLGEDFDFVYFVGPSDFARYSTAMRTCRKSNSSSISAWNTTPISGKRSTRG
jgi:hypothetical protein